VGERNGLNSSAEVSVAMSRCVPTLGRASISSHRADRKIPHDKRPLW